MRIGPKSDGKVTNTLRVEKYGSCKIGKFAELFEVFKQSYEYRFTGNDCFGQSKKAASIAAYDTLTVVSDLLFGLWAYSNPERTSLRYYHLLDNFELKDVCFNTPD